MFRCTQISPQTARNRLFIPGKADCYWLIAATQRQFGRGNARNGKNASIFMLMRAGTQTGKNERRRLQTLRFPHGSQGKRYHVRGSGSRGAGLHRFLDVNRLNEGQSLRVPCICRLK